MNSEKLKVEFFLFNNVQGQLQYGFRYMSEISNVVFEM
jgi:hypothetical protein